MEADGTSSDNCEYCRKPGHRLDDCRERGSHHRVEAIAAWVFSILLVPIMLSAFIVGTIFASAQAGARAGFRHWPEWCKVMKRVFGLKDNEL